jgi:hypothetical protein
MGFLGRRKLMFSTGVALVVVAMVVVTVQARTALKRAVTVIVAPR